MTFEQIYSQVRPYTLLSPVKAERLYDHVLSTKPNTAIEMGFRQGGSTMLIAAAMQRAGGGRLITFDLPSAREFSPNIITLSEALGLSEIVDARFCSWCCEWELGKWLDLCCNGEEVRPEIDFAFLDGGHYWTATGFAFCILERLMRPGGWVLFDDVEWTIAKDLAEDDWGRKLPLEARSTPMVRMVFELLVRTSPSFHNFIVTCGGQFAWAQKRILASPERDFRMYIDNPLSSEVKSDS